MKTIGIPTVVLIPIGKMGVVTNMIVTAELGQLARVVVDLLLKDGKMIVYIFIRDEHGFKNAVELFFDRI